MTVIQGGERDILVFGIDIAASPSPRTGSEALTRPRFRLPEREYRPTSSCEVGCGGGKERLITDRSHIANLRAFFGCTSVSAMI